MAKQVAFPADPTKEFFVEMLTRDVRLNSALLDLIDNSVDGAIRAGSRKKMKGFYVKMRLDGERFVVEDNCGGIPFDIAMEYAFKFGRPGKVEHLEGSLGRFGVGMKRTLFKLGRAFEVSTVTPEVSYKVAVDLDQWLKSDKWEFPCTEKKEHKPVLDLEKCGTTLTSSKLNRSVVEEFSDEFWTGLRNKVRRVYRQIIQLGFEIHINGSKVEIEPLKLVYDDHIKPAKKGTIVEMPEYGKVQMTAIAGLAKEGNLGEMGWYIFCNGRLVADAQQSPEYGFEKGGIFPAAHSQYNRFRGYLYITAKNPAALPWNTSKDAVDTTHQLFKRARAELMFPLATSIRPIFDDYKREMEENKERTRPIVKAFVKPEEKPLEEILMGADRPFARPAFKSDPIDEEGEISIQYSRPREIVEKVQKHLKVKSARKAGEKTFDLYAERAGLQD